VSPKVADPAMRIALIEHAARLIAEEGRDALTLRRLAAEVGASTMAIYTHFGGMDELQRQVRIEALARLAQHLGGVEATDDPVADLVVLGRAYHVNATSNPNLYRVMFMERIPADEAEIPHDESTFQLLVGGVARCLAADRFHPAEPLALANQLWALSHGVAALELAGILDADRAAATLEALCVNVMVGFGDDPERLAASFERARARMSLH
jgi:AcrR family transcriptional regulator